MKQSIINWQTGEPKKEGMYIVTLLNGSVALDECIVIDNTDEEDIAIWRYWDEDVIAWCKLTDIEPYKEEEVWKESLSMK